MVIANKSRVEESILSRGRYVIDTSVAVVDLAPTLVPCIRYLMVFVAMMKKTRTRKIELLYKNVGSND